MYVFVCVRACKPRREEKSKEREKGKRRSKNEQKDGKKRCGGTRSGRDQNCHNVCGLLAGTR